MTDERTSTPEPEDKGDATQPPSEAEPKRKRRPVSKAGVVILVAAVAATVTIAWFWPQIGGWFLLKAWSKEAPVDAVKSFVAALEANDETKVKAYGFGGELQTNVEDGKIVSMKPATSGPMMWEVADRQPVHGAPSRAVAIGTPQRAMTRG